MFRTLDTMRSCVEMMAPQSPLCWKLSEIALAVTSRRSCNPDNQYTYVEGWEQSHGVYRL